MTAKKSSLGDPKSKRKYRVRNWPDYDKADPVSQRRQR